MDSFTLQKCQDVMVEIRKHPISEMFLEPVDPVRDEAPNYLEIVKKPMDISTVQKKLDGREYKTVQEWKEDMNLIPQNAMTYNGKKNPIGVLATEFQKVFRDLSRCIADGPIQNWHNQLVDIKREIKAHVEKKIAQALGEADVSFANPKYQTKDIDTNPIVQRFIIHSMPLNELQYLKSKLADLDKNGQEKSYNIVSKYTPIPITEPINLDLLPPAALIELKELVLSYEKSDK